MNAQEANFDGLVGPTHNYAGLSFGNVASLNNEKSAANPKAAAKQGLRKMKQLADLGFAQGVLPPQERPSLRLLRELGFSGKDADVIAKAAKQAPELLAAASSASAMWTANAATVSPSADPATAACTSRRRTCAASCIARSSTKRRAARCRRCLRTPRTSRCMKH